MDLYSPTLIRSLTTITGGILAGPVGSLLGNFVGALLPAALTKGKVDIVSELVDGVTSSVLKEGSAQLSRYLSSDEQQRINHDLQAAFRDACREALHDLGGRQCFPQSWRQQERDVPPQLIFPLTAGGARLWHEESPLADQVCDCFQRLEQALLAEQLLPLNPTSEQSASSVYVYLEVDTPQAVTSAFYDEVFAPFLERFTLLRLEVPALEQHLRAHLLDRTLVHLGELLKARPAAWRAFNRLMLETVLSELRASASVQTEILERLDVLVSGADQAPFVAWSDGLADLLAATGRLEKRMEESFAAVLQRLADQHGEVLTHFDRLWSISLRVETQLEQTNIALGHISRILEQGGRRGEEDAPPVALDAPPAPGVSPFNGLDYFDEADAGRFFGREQMTARLVGRLREGMAGRRFLAVVGASGSGKSSLVRAGVIPALRRGKLLSDGSLPPHGSTRWAIRVLTPTAHPVRALAASLMPEAGSLQATATLQVDLESRSDNLGLAARRLLSQNGASHLLLVVDQFEELFTACQDEVLQRAFVDCLMRATATGEPVTVLIILRGDFYTHCARFEPLREALEEQQIIVGQMSAAELRRAIEMPAQQAGWEFERGVVELILRDMGEEPGSLPLLSYALLQTWEHRRGRTMLLESYIESGGVRGAIAKTAEGLYRSFNETQQAIARNILLRLTELGEGTPDTRRRAPLSELISRPEEETTVGVVLQQLAAARLVTTTREQAKGQATAEVAHEALIREWPTLRNWLEDDHEWLRVHRRLTEDVSEWNEHNRDPSLLYHGARLERVEELAQMHGGEVNALEQAFLAQSRARVEEEIAAAKAQVEREIAQAEALAAEQEKRAEEQAQANRKLRRRAYLLGGALIFAALFLIGASVAAIFARQQQAHALANQLASQARIHIDDLDQSLLLSLAAGRGGDSVESLSSLLAGLNAAPSLSTFLHQEGGAVFSVAFDHSGETLVSGSDDGSVTLWSVQERQPLGTLRRAGARVWVVAVRSQDDLIATGDDEGVITLWTRASDEPFLVLEEHQGAVRALAFSPDGQWLASAGEDQDVLLWRLERLDEEPPRPLRLRQHSDVVRDLSFAHDSTLLASASNDGTVATWDVATQTLARPPLVGLLAQNSDTFNDEVVAVAFSPANNSLLATAGWNSLITVWNIESGTPVQEQLRGHTAPIVDIAFSPDGSLLASSGVDRRLILWDTDSWQSRRTMSTGHSDWVNGLAFTGDGRQLALASGDASVSLWDLEQDAPLGQRHFHSHDSAVHGVAHSPAANVIATGGADGSVILWNADTGLPLRSQRHLHTASVNSLAFTSDGERLASGSSDGNILVWDVQTGDVARRLLSAPRGYVSRLAFSPDDSLLAAAVCTATDESYANCAESEVQVWEMATGRRLPNVLQGYTAWVSGLLFSAEGQILTLSYSGGWTWWDPRSGEQTAGTVEAQLGNIWSAAAMNRQRDTFTVASCNRFDDDGCTQSQIIINVRGSELSLPTQPGLITALALNPDGSLLAAGDLDGRILLWDVQSQEVVDDVVGHDALVTALDFSGDGTTLVSGATDGTIRIWQANAFGESKLAEGRHLARVGQMATSASGRLLVSTGSDGKVVLWELPTWDQKHVLQDALNWTTDAVPTPNGRHLLMSHNTGKITIWDTETGTIVDTFEEHQAPVLLGLAVADDGHTVASVGCMTLVLASSLCTSVELLLWDLNSHEVLARLLLERSGFAYPLALHPQGRLVAVGFVDGTILLWNPATGEQLALKEHNQDVFTLAFDANGERLLSGSRDTTVILWNLADPENPGSTRLTGHTNSVFDVAFSPDGRLAASSSADTTVRLWDLEALQPLGALVGHYNYVTRLAFFDGGRRLISGGHDSFFLEWDLDHDAWRSRACAIAGRNLSREEWEQYVGGRRYQLLCPELPAPTD